MMLKLLKITFLSRFDEAQQGQAPPLTASSSPTIHSTYIYIQRYIQGFTFYYGNYKMISVKKNKRIVILLFLSTALPLLSTY